MNIKKLLPMILLISCEVFGSEIKEVDELVSEKSFSVRVMDRNFKSSDQKLVVQSRVIGTHSFIGADPVRSFADSRECNLDVAGSMIMSIQGESIKVNHLHIDKYAHFLNDPDTTRDYFTAFTQRNSYRKFDCEKSIIRLNSYIYKYQYRRSLKLEKDLTVFLLESLVNPSEKFLFVYPSFEMNETLSSYVDKKIISNVYERVFDRLPDEYEQAVALENKEGKDWGYALQKELSDKLESRRAHFLDRDAEALLDKNIMVDNMIEDFWIDNCLSADIDYELYKANNCQQNIDLESFALAIPQRVCIPSRDIQEVLTKHYPSQGEKCQKLARANIYGNRAKNELENIHIQISDLESHFFEFKLEHRDTYDRVLKLVKTGSDLHSRFLQNQHRFKDFMTTVSWDHQLFYKGYTDTSAADKLEEILSTQRHRRILVPPSWTDPVNPRFLLKTNFPGD